MHNLELSTGQIVAKNWSASPGAGPGRSSGAQPPCEPEPVTNHRLRPAAPAPRPRAGAAGRSRGRSSWRSRPRRAAASWYPSSGCPTAPRSATSGAVGTGTWTASPPYSAALPRPGRPTRGRAPRRTPGSWKLL